MFGTHAAATCLQHMHLLRQATCQASVLPAYTGMSHYALHTAAPPKGHCVALCCVVKTPACYVFVKMLEEKNRKDYTFWR